MKERWGASQGRGADRIWMLILFDPALGHRVVRRLASRQFNFEALQIVRLCTSRCWVAGQINSEVLQIVRFRCIGYGLSGRIIFQALQGARFRCNGPIVPSGTTTLASGESGSAWCALKRNHEGHQGHEAGVVLVPLVLFVAFVVFSSAAIAEGGLENSENVPRRSQLFRPPSVAGRFASGDLRSGVSAATKDHRSGGAPSVPGDPRRAVVRGEE